MSIETNPDDYGNVLLDHLDSPYHKGTLATATHTHREQSRLSGDWVELQLEIRDKTIHQAWFNGQGSLTSQAAASVLCEYIEDRMTGVLEQFQATDLLALLSVPLTPTRQQCALLSFRALKAIIYSLDTPGQ